VLALIVGAAWLVAFLVLAGWQVVRHKPSHEGPWPWPVWIAIASPVAAALAPLWLFLFLATALVGHTIVAAAVFGPLLLTALAGVVGVVASLIAKKPT
jgi:hypothetical protein